MEDGSVTERIANERIAVWRSFEKDVVRIFKIRYVSIITTLDGSIINTEYRSFYGGITGAWTEFQQFEKLDMDAPGIISLTGKDYMDLLDGQAELARDEDRTHQLRRLRDALDVALSKGTT